MTATISVTGGSAPATPKKKRLRKTLTKVHVPMVFGLDVLKDIPHDSREPELRSFIRDYIKSGRIDLSPPYQREEAWSTKKERQWMASLFSQTMAIPPFFLSKKNNRFNCVNYYALDCRQRVTAIKHWINDLFRIEVMYTYTDEQGGIHTKKKKMNWSEMQADEDCQGLVDIFNSKKVPLVIFDYSPLEDQRMIFTALNNGEPLNVDEQTYCTYFLARRFLGEVFNNVFANVKVSLTPKVKEGRRFAHIRTAHELLLLSADLNLRGTPEARPVRKQDRMASAQQVHKTLKDQGFNYEDPVGQVTYGYFGLKTAIPVLRGLCDLLHGVFTAKANLGRTDNTPGNHILPRNVIDPVAFLFKMVYDKRTTVQVLKGKQDGLVEFLTAYYQAKPKEEMNRSTSDVQVMRKKFEEMDKLFTKHLA